ncbi:hypothetical protein Apmu_0139_12 [Acidiphilium multivorum AIU301]|uniref:hypothetical protein n=1 Tax=Acidiphilium multivorum TaxID=62140 RepID=UPI0005A06AFE|nr:hypothetical protein [Acidiphilium multivorum]GAN74135.1 hypothetical protein Apmu_0139_12 [Acidiphilium multivorum AIU301]
MRAALPALAVLLVACSTGQGSEPVGHAASGPLSATLRRSPRGPGNFQYFLSVRNNGRVIFSSPGDPTQLIPRLVRPAGAPRWFPQQRAHLAGIAVLGGRRFAIVAEHNTGADCGEGTVGLVGSRGELVTVRNPCALDVAIGHGEVRLAGPYYAPGAPLVDPTIVRAAAILTFRGGKPVESPPYFRMRTSSPP